MVGRRNFIRIVSFLLAAAVCLAAAASDAAKARSDYGEALGRARMSSLVSLCEYSSELSAGLRTLAVAPNGATADPAAYVCSRALGAKGNSACFGAQTIQNIVNFLDGAYRFAEDYPDEPAEEQRAAAIKLSDYAEELYCHLSDVSAAVLNGDIALLEGEGEFIGDRLDFSNGSEGEIMSLTASSMPPSVRAQAGISREAARERASELFGVDSALWRGGDTENCGGLEVYRFTYGSVLVDIGTAGGEVAAFTVYEPCSAAEVGAESAAASAAEFLKKQNFPELTEISRCEREFRTELEFAPLVGGVLHLNSPIKVAVCRCCSEVIRFDCSEYIKNYREIETTDSKPRLDRLLPAGFSLLGQRLCVADIGGRARLCYLADCVFQGERARMFFDYFSLRALKSEPIS